MKKGTYTAPPVVVSETGLNPNSLVKYSGGTPQIDFHWKEIKGKRRLVGHPNKPMRRLHELFGQYIRLGISQIVDRTGWQLHKLPSATGFVQGSNPLLNASKHIGGKFFYITDLRNAYPSINLNNLAKLILYIKKFEEYRDELTLETLALSKRESEFLEREPFFRQIKFFLVSYCSGIGGEGLAVGGSISPYLMNLYCEGFVNWRLRKLCEKKKMVFSQYADDFVFSREKPITSDIRREIRECIYSASLSVNHRKSFVFSREMGTVFVTKIGLSRLERQSLEDLKQGGKKLPRKSVLVFPRWKRRKLHGIIGTYLTGHMDWPEKVSGYIAEFLHYYKKVNPTKTDRRTFALCKEFEAAWAKYKKPWNHH